MKLLNKRIGLGEALLGITPFRLWSRHIWGHWPIYMLGIVTVFLTNLSEVLLPKFIQWILDDLMAGKKDFTDWFLALFSVLLIQILGRVGWRQSFGQQTHRVASKLKSLLWDRAKYLPKHRLESDLSPGELMNIAAGDIGICRSSFGFTLVGTFDFIFLVSLTLISMLSINVETTLWALFIMPTLPYFLTKIARREYQQHQVAQKSLSELTDLATQSVSTVRLQRLTQTENYWRSKLIGAADDYRGKRYEVLKTSLSFIPISGIAPLISYAILLAVTIPKTFSGEMSIGAFVAMQSYIFLIQSPMQELGFIISEWQQGFASMDRVTRTFGEKEEPQLRAGGQPIKETETCFQIENLSFAYSNDLPPLFKNFSLCLKKGGRLGIKGAIGSGKSTLLQILSGFEKRYSGSVKLFGEDIHKYSHESLRNTVSIVPQKPFLFADTVRNNVNLQQNLTDDQVWRYLELACLADDIRKFPEGLDTKLGEWGVNLSGGQKQRLTLARALARQSQVLLLDDCLSAVDTVTEEKILKNLHTHLSDITLVWVAHRSSTLRHCETILEFPLT